MEFLQLLPTGQYAKLGHNKELCQQTPPTENYIIITASTEKNNLLFY